MTQQSVEFRRAGIGDTSAVRDLTRAAYAKWVERIGREPKPMTADYSEAVRRHVIDLLYVDSELVGLVEVAVETGHLLIVNVAVSPAFQHRGHGRTLMAHAEQLARASGLGEVRLYTNARFAENLRLYTSLGYRTVRVQPVASGALVHMSKPV